MGLDMAELWVVGSLKKPKQTFIINCYYYFLPQTETVLWTCVKRGFLTFRSEGKKNCICAYIFIYAIKEHVFTKS